MGLGSFSININSGSKNINLGSINNQTGETNVAQTPLVNDCKTNISVTTDGDYLKEETMDFSAPSSTSTTGGVQADIGNSKTELSSTKETVSLSGSSNAKATTATNVSSTTNTSSNTGNTSSNVGKSTSDFNGSKKSEDSARETKSDAETKGKAGSSSTQSGFSTGSNGEGNNQSSSSTPDAFNRKDDIGTNKSNDSSSPSNISSTSFDSKRDGNYVTKMITDEEIANELAKLGFTKKDIERIISGEADETTIYNEICSDPERSALLAEAQYLSAYDVGVYSLEDLKTKIQDLKNEKASLENQMTNTLKPEDQLIKSFVEYKIMLLLAGGEDLDSILEQYKDETIDGSLLFSDMIYYYSTSADIEKDYGTINYSDYITDEFVSKVRGMLEKKTKKSLFGSDREVYVYDKHNSELQTLFNQAQDAYNGIYDKSIVDATLAINPLSEEVDNLAQEITRLEYIQEYVASEVKYQRTYYYEYVTRDNFSDNAYFDINHLNDLLSSASSMEIDQSKNIVISDKEQGAIVIQAILNGELRLEKEDIILDDGTSYSQTIAYDKDGNKYQVNGNFLLVDEFWKHFDSWQDYITTNETDVLNYIINTEGLEAGYKYLEDISFELDSRWHNAQVRADQQYASEHPIAASVISVFSTPVDGLKAAFYSLNAYFTGDPIRRVDVYSAGDVWRAQIAQDIYVYWAQQGHENIGEALSFTYSTGMSMADSLSLIGLSVATGGTGSVFISATVMGSRAYVSTLNDALDRNISDGRAIILALASAVTETLMENYSLSHLMNLESSLSSATKSIIGKLPNNSFRQKLAFVGLSALSQAFVEGEEELATEVFNFFTDELVAGDLSNFDINVRNYVMKGASNEEAFKAACKDLIGQFKDAFMGGLVSGLCFGYVKSSKTSHNISKDIAKSISVDFNGKQESFVDKLEALEQQQEIAQSALEEARQQMINTIKGSLKKKFKQIASGVSEFASDNAGKVDLNAFNTNTKTENINLVSLVLSDMPSNITDVEKARYIYLKLPDSLSFNTKFNNATIKDRAKIYTSKVDLESFNKNQVICREWAQIYSGLLSKAGIENKIIDNGHQSVCFKADGKVWIADATQGTYTDLARAKYGDETHSFGLSISNDMDKQKGIMYNTPEINEQLKEMDNKFDFYANKKSKLTDLKEKLKPYKDSNLSTKEKLEIMFKEIGILKDGYYEGKDFVRDLEYEIFSSEELEHIKGVELKRNNKNSEVDIVQCICYVNDDQVSYYLLSPNNPITEVKASEVADLAMLGYGKDEKEIPGMIYPKNFTIGKIDMGSLKYRVFKKGISGKIAIHDAIQAKTLSAVNNQANNNIQSESIGERMASIRIDNYEKSFATTNLVERTKDNLNNYVQGAIGDKVNSSTVKDLTNKIIEHITGNYNIGFNEDYEETQNNLETLTEIISNSDTDTLINDSESISALVDGSIATGLMYQEHQEQAQSNFSKLSAKAKQFFKNAINKILDINMKFANTIARVSGLSSEGANSYNNRIFSKFFGGITYDLFSGSLIAKRHFTSVTNSKIMLDKINNDGIIHFTSLETANKILESGYFKPSTVLESDLTKKKCFFFAGTPTFEDLLINIPAYDVMTAIRIKPTSEQVQDLKYRALDDGAIAYDGKFNFTKDQAEIVYYGLDFNEQTGSIYLKELTKEEASTYKVSDKVKELYNYNRGKNTLKDRLRMEGYGLYAQYKHHHKLLQIQQQLREIGYENVPDEVLADIRNISEMTAEKMKETIGEGANPFSSIFRTEEQKITDTFCEMVRLYGFDLASDILKNENYDIIVNENLKKSLAKFSEDKKAIFLIDTLNLDTVRDAMIKKYGEETGLYNFKVYLKTGNSEIITRNNNAREIASRISEQSRNSYLQVLNSMDEEYNKGRLTLGTSNPIEGSTELNNFFASIGDINDGTYGMDQAAVAKMCIYKLSGKDYSYYEAEEIVNKAKQNGELLPRFKKLATTEKYFELKDTLTKKGFTDDEASIILSSIDDAGACSYACASNMILYKFRNNEALFQDTFGYSMYRNENGAKVFNEQLLLDLYLFANDTAHGGKFITNNHLNRNMLSDTIDVFGRNILDTRQQTFLAAADTGFKAEIVTDFLNSKRSGYYTMSQDIFNNVSGNELNQNQINGLINDVIDEMNKNKAVRLGMYTYGKEMRMIAPSGANYGDMTIAGEGGGHAVTITSVLEDGFLVSSWGRAFLIPFEDLSGGSFRMESFEIYNLGNSNSNSSSTTKNEGVINRINEINKKIESGVIPVYTIDNIKEINVDELLEIINGVTDNSKMQFRIQGITYDVNGLIELINGKTPINTSSSVSEEKMMGNSFSKLVSMYGYEDAKQIILNRDYNLISDEQLRNSMSAISRKSAMYFLVQMDDLENIKNTMYSKYGDDGIRRFMTYLENGDSMYITRDNGARDLADNITEESRNGYKQVLQSIKNVKLIDGSNSSLSFFANTGNYNEGTYGLDQGIIEKLCTYELNGYTYTYRQARDIVNNARKNKELIPRFQKIGNHIYGNLKMKLMNKGFTNDEASIILSSINDAGACSYAAALNMILYEFRNNESLFHQIFGYSMYREQNGTRVFNEEILLDLYLYANDTKNGGSFFTNNHLNKEMLSDTIDVCGRNILDANQQVFISTFHGLEKNALTEFLNSKGYTLSVTSQKIADNTLGDTLTNDQLNQIVNGVVQQLNRNSAVQMCLFSEKGEIRFISPKEANYEDTSTKIWGEGGGHAVTITGVAQDGFWVSSWGLAYLIPFSDLSSGQFVIDSINILNLEGGK